MLNKVITAKWESEKINNCNDKNIVTTISDKLNAIKEPLFVLAYFSDSVRVGYYKDNKIHFYKDAEIDTKKLEEIRIFNEKLELRLVRNGIDDGLRTFIGRIINDSICCDCKDLIDKDEFIYDEKFLVYGRGIESSKADNWIKVKEDRGGELWLPLEHMEWLGVRNYLKYDDDGLKFVGNRLLGFYNEDGDYLGGGLSGLDGR